MYHTFLKNVALFFIRILLWEGAFVMNCKEAEKFIGYNYKNTELLKTALTHSSYANEKKVKNNERLEFLGDSVLSIIVSDYIYKNYRDVDEGKLTQIRASLVCEQSLAKIAKRINLGSLILLGHGEEMSGVRKRASVVSDAFEAVLASIYLDGGIEQARIWLLNLIEEDIKSAVVNGSMKDFKTRLQEAVQKKGSVHSISYETIEELGEAHNRVFKVAVSIDGKTVAYGEGKSKKSAEQNAARAYLEKEHETL